MASGQRGYKITARTARAIERLLDGSGGGTVPQPRNSFRDPAANILIKNTFGSAIPPYSIVQPTGVILTGTRPVVEVTQYDGTYTGEFLFSWHYEIAVGSTGVSQAGRLVRCRYSNGAGAAEAAYQPTANAWTLETGGSLAMSCGATGTNSEMIAILKDGFELDACDDFWGTLPTVTLTATDQVLIFRDGCLKLADVDPCEEPAEEVPNSSDGLQEEFFV